MTEPLENQPVYVNNRDSLPLSFSCFTIEYSVHLFKLRADWQSLETLYILQPDAT